jgi:hypothetical protein
MTGHRRARSLVRAHVITHGRIRPRHAGLDLVTLLIAANAPLTGLSPEQRRVMQLCHGGPLTVADIARYLGLPAVVVKILVSDLIDSGHLTRPAPAVLPDADLIKEVLDGLRARL